MNSNPYDIDIASLVPSRIITDEKEKFQMKLIARFRAITLKMDKSAVLAMTGLNKEDYSKLIGFSEIEKFSSDRLIKLLDKLGYKVEPFIIAHKKTV